MADSAPSVSTGVEAEAAPAPMDVEEPVDEHAQAKVVREFVDDMMAKIVAKYPDGERQRTAEPRVPSRVFHPHPLLVAMPMPISANRLKRRQMNGSYASSLSNLRLYGFNVGTRRNDPGFCCCAPFWAYDAPLGCIERRSGCSIRYNTSLSEG